jgi:hypothetical protein
MVRNDLKLGGVSKSVLCVADNPAINSFVSGVLPPFLTDLILNPVLPLSTTLNYRSTRLLKALLPTADAVGLI